MQSLEAEKAWSESTGKGVIVAVLDSGVNGQHPDLERNVLPGKNFSSGDPADRETKNNHGTAMASIIAGHGHGSGGTQGMKGIAPDAKILPVKESDDDADRLDNPDAVSYAEPLRYAVDNGAKIVNMSFSSYDIPSIEERKAIAYAIEKDVLLVASSGNSGSGNEQYPAATPGVLAVGAVDKNGKIWEKSSYGSHLLLTAPGVGMDSAAANGGYRHTAGTSNATAYVSGAAALVRAKFPELTAGQVANRLVKTASVPSGVSAPDERYGYGVIRPYEALTADIPAGPKNGPLKDPEQVDGVQPPGTAPTADDSGSDSTAAILGFVGFLGILTAVIVVVVLLVKRSRRRRNTPPPGAYPGYGAPPHPGEPHHQGYPQQTGGQQPGYPPGPRQ
ncbi:type VII secretion-associated serine protease mycosin [Streptomyces alkaliterrae]|uniref:type VII secretion-associated serine protease mycosin n=1 Tax=Streptomyces alkaliterrae TaxID=2213162 RepID=UPI002B216393|nr:type VII secretion-associated serine protease mycosin [Streptomyces alkaliterrae]